MRRGRLPRLFASAGAVALAVGCQLVVPSDLPELRCASTAASACPAGMACDLASGRCVAEAGAPLDDATTDAPIPDGDAGDGAADAETGPLDIGGKCRVDADCKSDLCGTSTILTTPIVSSTGPICTTPCCTSSECPSGSICFAGGTGGSYCVPAALAKRELTARSSKTAGASCAKNDECRSGACVEGRCLDTCCVTTNCASGAVCRLATVSTLGSQHDVWVCAAPLSGATTAPGDACSDQTECKTEVCIPSGTGLCRPACSSTASCRSIPNFSNGHCLYGQSGLDFFKFCFATTTGTDAADGQPCALDGDCQSDYCDPELSRCAEVCSRTADCPKGFTCRPSAVGTPYLRCVK